MESPQCPSRLTRQAEFNRADLAIGLALALGVGILFWPVTTFEFLNFDDPEYVTKNPMVQAGLTFRGALWALLTTHASNWHPLAWLSHMLDCELVGLQPAGHHLTNLLFHLANTLLLFGALRQLTAARWPSAVVAALFACHPLRVESVAWVAERKDVLSAFFGLLALHAYARYAAARAGGSTKAGRAYAAALLFFGLGLLSKPMLVTWPLLLLLLDYWPLRRGPFVGEPVTWRDPAARAQLFPLLREKIPFLILSLFSGVMTLYAQQQGGAVATMTHVPLDARVANAVVAYALYLWKTIWPVELAVFYPHPHSWPVGAFVAAAALLATLSAGVARARRRYLTAGWLWFLVLLTPVIGLVQVGDQAMADRYTYLPQVGLFIAATWGGSELLARHRTWRTVGAGVTAGALLVLAGITRWQLSHWRDSETLFTRALEVTRNNYIAHNNLGNALDLSGRHELAKANYQETLRIRPDFAGTHYNLANVLFREGNLDQARHHYATAVELRPDYADAHFNLGVVLTVQGRWAEAEAHVREALRWRPKFAEAHHQLGLLRFHQGNAAEAIAHYQNALKLRPHYAEALVNLGMAFEREGKPDDAAAQYRAALEINPHLAHAHANLAILLARRERPDLALPHFRAVTQLEPANADAHYNLANALAELGELTAAAAHYSEALRLNPNDERAREKLERVTAQPQPARP